MRRLRVGRRQQARYLRRAARRLISKESVTLVAIREKWLQVHGHRNAAARWCIFQVL